MAEVTISGTVYPSFCTVAFASEYLAADIVRATPWAAGSADNKARALVSATRLLMQQLWNETPDLDTEQPEVAQQVCALLAADILAKPALANGASTEQTQKRVKAGSVEVENFRSSKTVLPLPEYVFTPLVRAGLIGGADNGVGFVIYDGMQTPSRFPDWEL
jgi:hypothetical protein